MTARVRPWLARADWREGVIHWRGDGRPVGKIALAVSVTAIVIGAIAFNEASGYSRLMLVLVITGGFIFAIKGIGDEWRSERAFGASTFTFEHVPFLLGGKLKGVIRTNFAGLGEETRLALSCFHGFYDEKSGPHWRAIRVLLPDHMQRDRDKVSIDVDFDIPDDQPPTSFGLTRFAWELSVLKGFPTGRRRVMFEVPVFHREAEAFVQETSVARGAKSEVRKALSVFDD